MMLFYHVWTWGSSYKTLENVTAVTVVSFGVWLCCLQQAFNRCEFPGDVHAFCVSLQRRLPSRFASLPLLAISNMNIRFFRLLRNRGGESRVDTIVFHTRFNVHTRFTLLR
jgi:hypothetical protein